MDFSKEYKLKMKIDELKSETGLSDTEIKKIFIKEYLLEGEEKSNDELWGEFLRK